jgi:hypothetical protein
VPSLHFAVGVPDFASVLAAAVAAVFPEPAGVEVSEAGAPLLLVIELLLAGAVLDDVGPAAVAAAVPVLAGLEVSVALPLAEPEVLLTPPWWLQAPLPDLDVDPSLQVTVELAACCACSGAARSKLMPTINDSGSRITGTFCIVFLKGKAWREPMILTLCLVAVYEEQAP